MRDEPIWIAIKNAEIVGTPYGPEVPNGKYVYADRLNSEGGGELRYMETRCSRDRSFWFQKYADTVAVSTDASIWLEKTLDGEYRSKFLLTIDDLERLRDDLDRVISDL